MSEGLLFESGGLFSTLQDLGRFGYQRFGISASGVMDPVSMQIANALVGNPLDVAVVEITLTGPTFRVEADRCRIALAGGAFPIAINGTPAEGFRAYDLGRGDTVRIGTARSGMRGALSVAGGFAIEPVLGSLSTHSRSALGGWQGRALREGDRLPLAGSGPAGSPLFLEPARRPRFDGPIRVLLGPQDDAFTQGGIATFLSSAFTVSAKADRMGCQLDGPVIEHKGGFNIVSDGIANGSVQVPGSGRPILLLADRQTTGGYPKIATVIGPDLAKLAHRRSGDEIRFARVDTVAAEGIAREHRALLREMLDAIVPLGTFPAENPTERLLSEESYQRHRFRVLLAWRPGLTTRLSQELGGSSRSRTIAIGDECG